MKFRAWGKRADPRWPHYFSLPPGFTVLNNLAVKFFVSVRLAPRLPPGSLSHAECLFFGGIIIQ